MTEEQPIPVKHVVLTANDVMEIADVPPWVEALKDKPWGLFARIVRKSNECAWPKTIDVICMCRLKEYLPGSPPPDSEITAAIVPLRAIPVEGQNNIRGLMYAGLCPRCDRVHYVETSS